MGEAGRCGRWRPRLACVTRASLDKQPHEVAAMFDGVAARYDLTNTVLSLRPGPRLAPGHPGGARPRARASRCSTSAPAPACPPRSWPAPARTRSAPTSRSACCSAGRRVRPTVPLLAGDALAAAVRRRHLRRGDHLLRAAQRRRHRRRAARRWPGSPGPAAGWWSASSATRPTAAFRTVYLAYLMRVAAGGGPARCPATRTRTSISPSRSGPGRTRPGWPRGSPAPAGARVAWRNLTGGVVALHRATRLIDELSRRSVWRIPSRTLAAMDSDDLDVERGTATRGQGRATRPEQVDADPRGRRRDRGPGSAPTGDRRARSAAGVSASHLELARRSDARGRRAGRARRGCRRLGSPNPRVPRRRS